MRLLQRQFWTRRVLIVVTTICLVLFVGALLLKFVAVPAIVDSMIDKSVRLEENTIQWDRFTHLPIVIDFNLYFFEVMNPEGVQNRKEMPVLVERGPYVYEQFRNRSIKSTNDDEDTVSFENVLDMKFSKEKSGNRSDEDHLNFINPIHIVVTQETAAYERLFAYGCLPKFLEPRYQSLIMQNTTVRELVFDGIIFAKDDVDVGVACNAVKSLLVERTKTMRNVQQVFNSDGTLKHLKFSYLGFKLEHSDGVFEISRGIKDVSSLGHIKRWNGLTELGIWTNPNSTDTDRCNRVRGCDSTTYPPRVDQDTVFEIFSTDICRTIPITFDREEEFMGISGYRFVPGERTLWSDDPETDCYCTKEVLDPQGNPSCYLDGIIEVSKCFGEPVLLSFPHFLYAHEKYRSLYSNLQPDPEKHQIYLIVEPKTGTPLVGMQRVQLNLVLRPVSFYKLMENVVETIIPILWIEMSAKLTQDLIDELDSKLFSNLRIANIVIYVLIVITACGLLVSLIFLTLLFRSRENK